MPKYEIIQDFIDYNNPNQVLRPEGVTLHETATPGATDEREQDYFDEANRNASAHAFVDWDSITQTIDWFKVAWHAGKTANHKFIGVELCHPKTHDPEKFNEVWKRGVWLFAYLFVNILGITTVTKDNLMSHDEVSKRWRETDHTDPVGYFAEYGKTVDDFRNEVQEVINTMSEITVEQAKQIIKDKLGFADETIQYLWCYRWGDELLIRIAKGLTQ